MYENLYSYGACQEQTELKFCTDCGSIMINDRERLVCPRCGKRLNIPIVVEKKKNDETDKIVSLIVEKVEGLKVNRLCPSCGHSEAYRMLSASSGEHAGVKQERSIEIYRCSKCAHVWTEN
ncbi:hypothetical protein KEJ21_04025 [Candidatus Bathyarchaeota archaeon]|nr:hypothetical protein [Candidatus Bathyarchaeota archaeon]MBS7631129.1 hypothetical protein [Candidatus Bathyarchaeota archaeon]